MYSYKRNRGITLIALVVSIVVLIILAGVSISMLTGTNGLLRQASNAKEQTEIAIEEEQVMLAYEETKLNNLSSSVKEDDLLNQLISNKVDALSIKVSDIITVILKSGNIYEINNGDISYIGSQISYTTDDPIMMAKNSEKAFWQEDYKTKITKIETKPYIVKLENIKEEWDVSQEQNQSVMAYLLDDGSEGYELYILANGTIKMNSNASNFFEGFTNLKSANLSNFDTSEVQSMRYMFDNCNNLSFVDVSNFDTSNVLNMLGMFRACSKLTDINVSNFDTSKVKTMADMFGGIGCSTLNLSSFNTANVESMLNMFRGCRNLIELDLSNFDTSKVTDMRYMFYDCKSLKYLNIDDFDTSSVQMMDHNFSRL